MPRISKLKNGIVVMSESIPRVETIALNLHVNSGSRQEEAHENGVAHFLEHMAFKGTKTRSAEQIAVEFDNIGCYFNASTSRENTVYTARFLQEHLSKVLELIADIIQHSAFAPNEIDLERDVILQEIAQTNDDYDDLVFDLFMESIYHGQAFGRSILGTAESVRQIDHQALKNYVGKHYHGENIYISAAGKLDHDDFVALCDKLFGKITPKSNNTTNQALFHSAHIYLEKPIEQVNLVIGFEGVSYKKDDYLTYSILSAILGGGMSSRLFQEIREKRGLAYAIGSFNSSYTDTGIFGIFAGTGADQVAELITVATQELLKICDHISLEEVTRAYNQVKSSLMVADESTSYHSDILANNMINYGRIISKEELLDQLSKISVGQLKDAAAMLMNNNFGVAAIGRLNKLPSIEKIESLLKGR